MPAAVTRLAIFDLDGTLTRRDTFLPFLAGFLRRHPRRLLGLWRAPFALIEFAARDRDRGRLKQRLIRIVMGGSRRAEVESWAKDFAHRLAARGAFLPQALEALAAHRARGDRLVLLSASPDLYVGEIGRVLGFERSICTEIAYRGERLDGGLASANRRGEEKRVCLDKLRAEFPGVPISAFGNSASDIAHLRCADEAVLVNAGRSARRQARRAGIGIADWR